MNLIRNGISMLKNVKTYWKEPPAGKYMTFKEIFAYSVGGLGAYSIFTMAQALLLSTTNFIIGNTIGIQPMHIYIMYVISVITNIPLTMVRANMVDNVRYKDGKYRPYLLRMGIPTILLSLLFVFTPYAKVSYIWRCIFIFIYNFGLQFFYNFFYDAYENLIHVLSPNSQERTNVTSIKSMIYSLSPTVTNFITPLIAKKVADGNIYDLKVYQWLYPFISVIGVALIILVYAGTEEKIVVAKTHTIKIKFLDALREVAKNKYFWIISLAGWLGFLETCTWMILQWLYNYAKACTPEQYSMITLIRGTAYGWGLVLAPLFIKRWGKKKVLIVTNIFNVICLAMIYPSLGSIWTVLIWMYFNAVADSFILVLNPAIQADIRDYQHYKSGERIDGMFGAVALIGSFITMATSSVLPAVYEKFGIYQGNGYENMYDVLYDLDTFYKLCGVLVILSVVGAALNVIPYFFYDLTETKQKSIIKILQIRAMFEDYGNGVLKDEDMLSTMELIRDSKRKIKEGRKDITLLKQHKASKQEIKQAHEFNEQVEISYAVMEELERFTKPQALARLEWAKEVTAAGINGISNISKHQLERAKNLPKNTKEEKAIRKEAIADAKLAIRCKKAADKYYANGIKPYDENELNALYEKEKALMERKSALLKEKGEKDKIAQLSGKLKTISKEIKLKQQEYQHFFESTKVYFEAKKYIEQAENYARFGEIDTMYSAAAVNK